MQTKFSFLVLLFAIIFFGCNNDKTNENTGENTKKYYDEGEFVPIWAKCAVWYQIFPERFRNGDPSNDPTVEDIRGADPQEMPKSWMIHPWGSDWYKLQPYEIVNGEPEMWKHLLRRRYGGDLQGIIDELNYLYDLGITAIYLNPVFMSPSLHKYDGECYHHIDPNFGPDPEGDRELMKQENPLDPSTWVWTKADELALELIKQAHEKGIRIIFDGVFNHLGINSFAFKDVVKNQQNSPYKDWFIIKSWDNPETGEKFDYEGWWGVKSLPELREDSTGIVQGPKDYIFASTKRWMNPNGMGTEYGIDGWRLDVAFCVGHPFWKDWRKFVRSINPEAYLTAEIVDKPENVIPYLQGDEFDGEMSYNFAFACVEFFINPEPLNINATKFDERLKELRELYPKGVAYASMNLFDSHDVNRIGSYIVNRGIGLFRNWGEYYAISKAIDNPDYNVRKPNEEDIRLQKLLVIIQMTYVGAPMVYYGDEIGMWGSNDPDCRKPMIWNDIDYQDETYLPDQTTRKPDKVEQNMDLYIHYKKMIRIRNKHKSLQLGSFKTLVINDEKNIFVFEREYENEIIVVVFNNSDTNQVVEIPVSEGKFTDLLNEGEYEVKNSVLSLEIARKWGAVLLKE
ncbi:MAG: alpha-glucosidase C-terminal domain-containing protein [Bacteroidales bacterium]|nr:alpha-glucosidase C-terminal domain-containing protein [Bacteroidales bacterium]